MSSTVVLCAVVALIGIFQGATGQVLLVGRCERQPVTAMRNFDQSQYMGTWYEQQRYFAAVELGQKCVAINYSPLENGDIKVVSNSILSLTGATNILEGVASIPDQAEPAKQHVVFPIGDASVWVIDTDYQNYSVVHSCRNIAGYFRLVSSWLLSRDQGGFSQETSEKITNVLRLNKIDAGHFNDVDQHSCPATASNPFE